MDSPLRTYVPLEQRAKEQGYPDVYSMVSDALARGGSVLAASELIGCAHTALVKWLARHNLVVCKTATLRPKDDLR
ncbi:MAG: hypothetical protein HXY38_15020 [Chloroflexi bacterium]|nr:hypothetical protein [Chloroflexota bacterium]